MVRLVLGLALPAIFGVLALEALRDRDPRQAGFQFVPVAALVVIGEILGAGLTVGMWGVAF
jgi:hypothetical protein